MEVCSLIVCCYVVIQISSSVTLAEIQKDKLRINPMSNPFGTSSDDDSSLATVTLEDSHCKKSANPFAEQDEREKAAIPAAFKVLATIPFDKEDTDKDNKASRRESTNPWGYGDQESGESVNENNFNLGRRCRRRRPSRDQIDRGDRLRQGTTTNRPYRQRRRHHHRQLCTPDTYVHAEK